METNSFESIIFTIPGECPIKKNAAKHQSFRWDKKRQIKIPLPYNLVYYTDTYKQWVKNAIGTMVAVKNLLLREYPGIKLPLSGSYFVAFWIWRSRTDALSNSKGKVDLTNLLEAPQDLLSGRAGNFLDTGKRKFDHSLYQIFADDNSNIITCLSTSRVLYDPVNPRTQVFISPFTEEKFIQSHKLIFGEQNG